MIDDDRKKINTVIHRFLNGDDDAFTVLYELTVNDFTRFCYNRFSDISQRQVEDILQSSYLKMVKNIEELKDTDKFLPWAYRIVSNTAIDYLKKEQRYVYVNEELDGQSWLDRIPDRAEESFPEEHACDVEIVSAMVKALKRLSKDTRATFSMFYFDHMKISEIAEKQGIKEGTVKSRLFTAREKLRKSLRPFIK